MEQDDEWLTMDIWSVDKRCFAIRRSATRRSPCRGFLSECRLLPRDCAFDAGDAG